MNRWPEVRRVFALSALLVSVATGAWAVVIGGGGTFVPAVYVLVASVAVFFPMGIAFQVVAGQMLAAGLLLPAQELSWLTALVLVPILAGVVGTAELLSVVGRMETPMTVDATGVAGRAARAAAIGGGAFAVVLILGPLPGPAGSFSVVLAAAACAWLAVRLGTAQSR